jgi:hypothetical protein
MLRKGGAILYSPVCLRVTHTVINVFTELFVEDHNLFYLYAAVDLTEAIYLMLIRWTKLQYLRHRSATQRKDVTQ